MPEFSLRYGKGQATFTLDPELETTRIISPVNLPAEDQMAEIDKVIQSPIGFDWASLSGVRTVGIAINDKTRPVPHKYLLPPILKKLKKSGISNENIRFFIATGTHLPMRIDEFSLVVPEEILAHYTVESHDCDDNSNLEFLGKTHAGTPVWVNREYFQTDLKVVVGNIEPHHFMGFSGGNKSASIGLTGRQTINQNHSFLMDDRSRLGAYIDNPMRHDVEEIGRMIGVHLAVNAILNDQKQIVQGLAGDPLEVMAVGYPQASKFCQVPVDGPYDLVIASAGGYPKDINLYQAQKALTNASLITRDGGSVILVTECIEGVGSQGYIDFMEGIKSFEQALQKFKNGEFRVGPHKAYQFAKIGSRIRIAIKSSIHQSQVDKLLLTPVDDLQTFIDDEVIRLGGHPRIAILPLASTTLPNFLKN
jgi:nickel-dependent lactate racemase